MKSVREIILEEMEVKNYTLRVYCPGFKFLSDELQEEVRSSMEADVVLAKRVGVRSYFNISRDYEYEVSNAYVEGVGEGDYGPELIIRGVRCVPVEKSARLSNITFVIVNVLSRQFYKMGVQKFLDKKNFIGNGAAIKATDDYEFITKRVSELDGMF